MVAIINDNKTMKEMLLMPDIIITLIEILFSIALFVNAMLFIPQTISIYKTKSAQSISMITFVGFLCIQTISICYGIIRDDWILITGFFISLLCCATVVITAFYYKYHQK